MKVHIYAVAIVEKDNPRFLLADSFTNTRAAGAQCISGHVSDLLDGKRTNAALPGECRVRRLGIYKRGKIMALGLIA